MLFESRDISISTDWRDFFETSIMKTNIRSVLTLLAFLCLAAAGPQAQAVVPPPDGGYPDFTTAEGQKALFSLTSGAANTAVGWYSLFSNTEGSFSTATGAGALLFNTARRKYGIWSSDAFIQYHRRCEHSRWSGRPSKQHNRHRKHGQWALLLSVTTRTAHFNTAVGQQALSANISGQENTAIGFVALANHPTGNFNTAVGTSALLNTTAARKHGHRCSRAAKQRLPATATPPSAMVRSLAALVAAISP